jgi:hypothetical protein
MSGLGGWGDPNDDFTVAGSTNYFFPTLRLTLLDANSRLFHTKIRFPFSRTPRSQAAHQFRRLLLRRFSIPLLGTSKGFK